MNSGNPPQNLIKIYAAEGNLVENDLLEDSRVITTNLISDKLKEVQTGDFLKRNLIRHDSKKIAEELMKIVDHI